MGVKRMYAAIGHYWRGVYNDLTQYVRKCDACFEGEKLARPPGLDITSLPDQAAAAERQQRFAASGAAKEESEPPAAAPETRTRAQVMADRATRVWKKVSEQFAGKRPDVFCRGGHITNEPLQHALILTPSVLF